MTEEQKSTNTATLRTGVNTAVFSAIVAVIAKVTGASIRVEDLAPWMPLLAPVIGAAAAIFYRLSRVIADKWPSIGYVLFGTKKAPTKYVETTAKEV